MRFMLKEYQDEAVRAVLARLDDAKDDYRRKGRKIAFALSAITGAGKTVMASAVFEALFDGSEEFEVDGDPSATVLWVTDDPNLNEQTRYRIMEASDRLDATRLKVIGDGFNQEKLDTGKVFFLNRQKLTAKTYINHSDSRTFTLWETIQNTIEDDERTLYLVLDEAHRGMREQTKAKDAEEERDRSSTVLRLINGFDGVPPAPIVWGISATVDRFNDAMRGASDRTTLPNVVVDNAAVQASGLLKDTIILDLPDESGSFETTMAREAARAVLDASGLWHDYALREDMPAPVRPLLVVQVPNKPSAGDITALLDAIRDAWPDLEDNAIANVFGEHADETYGSHVVPYIAPQYVQEATHIRVLLAKDAVSTGWDCPRAETLLSLRPAKDRTYITQLLGRLVRTPLARRIGSDERLNAVTCFLPHFDLHTARDVAEVMTGAKQASDDLESSPGRRVLIDPVTMLWNETLPEAIKECFAALPSKAAPKAPAKPIKRLLNMAAEIAVDALLPDANAQAFRTIFAVLDGQVAQHKQIVDANVASILTADVRRISASMVTQRALESTRQIAADEQTVDDAFRLATRTFGAAVANGYTKRLACETDDGDDGFDFYAAKARVAALAMIPGVLAQVDAAADQLVSEWFSTLHARIKGLSEERRGVYDDILLQAMEPQQIDIVVPGSRIEMTTEVEDGKKKLLSTRERHLLADENGNYPVGKLGGWEQVVLDTELGRDVVVAWYRNPSTASKDAVQVPWKDGDTWKSMQPDFIFFSAKADGTIGASIVDPHGHHLSDALGKLRGLADFAEEYRDRFLRIDAISKIGTSGSGTGDAETLRLLDLTKPHIREIVRTSRSAADAYRSAGILYK